MRFSDILCCLAALATLSLFAGAQANSPTSSSSKHAGKSTAHADPGLNLGEVSNGAYRNPSLGLSCKIPVGWVLRTEEMNAPEEHAESKAPSGKVLLAAFSRPPEAAAEDVNATILITAEDTASFPGLKEAVQYFGPLAEVAISKGFAVDAGPYEFTLGTKTLVREDFHKDIGSRVMRQSTMAILAKNYAVSMTVIGGTADEVEELVNAFRFDVAKR